MTPSLDPMEGFMSEGGKDRKRDEAAATSTDPSRSGGAPVPRFLGAAAQSLGPGLLQRKLAARMARRNAGEAAESAEAGGDAATAFASATSASAEPVPYRQEMERAFGQDFSGVRSYTGRAAEMDAIGAHAAALGETVAFGSSNPSKEQVAHELTHIVQHRQAGGAGLVQHKSAVSDPAGASEREADALAASVVAGEQVTVHETPTAAVHREDKAPAVEPSPGPTLAKTESAGTDQSPADDASKSAPSDDEARLKEAIAAKKPDQIDAIAKTEALRQLFLDIAVPSDPQLVVQAVQRARSKWQRPAIEAAVQAGQVELTEQLAAEGDGKKIVIEACLAKGQVPLLLTLAGRAGVKGDWRKSVKSADYDRIIAAAPSPVTDRTQFEGVWFLFGDGKDRSETATRETFDHLFTSRILPAGDERAAATVGDVAGAGGVVTSWRVWFVPVNPDAKTTTSFLNAIRNLPQGQVNSANIAFVNQQKVQHKKKAPPPPDATWTDQAGGTQTIATSFYVPPINLVVIQADASGSSKANEVTLGQDTDKHGHAVGGSTEKGAPRMTLFQNHARHEVGHAVGNRKFDGVSETGDEWAKAYGGWKGKDQAAFIAAYWNKSGKTKLDFKPAGGAKDVEVDDAEVAKWLAGVLASGGKQPDGNAVSRQPGDVSAKFPILKKAYGDQQLTLYFDAVLTRSGGQVASMRDNGYVYPGFVPKSDEVFIYCSRHNPPGFVSYSKSAYTALLGSHGWYSLASYKEMFAEIYTNKYAGGKTPAAVNGKDPADFFQKLEASKDSQVVPSNVPPAPGTQPSGEGPGATASATPLVPPALNVGTIPLGKA
jgi:hypothetical protein